MCSVCDALNIPSGLSTGYSKQVADLFDGIATPIWKGTFTDLLHPELAQAMADEYFEAIQATYGYRLADLDVTDPHFAFLSRAERSCYEFASVKCNRLITELKEIAGKTNNLADFKTLAERSYTTYTDHYQETERIFAEGEITKAQRWAELMANKSEFPFGVYHAIHDERVRFSHLALDLLTLPILEFKSRGLMPPLDFRCRCKVAQSYLANISDISKIKLPEVPKAFRNKRVDDGVIMNPHVGYYNGMKPKMVDVLQKQSATLAPYRTVYKKGKGSVSLNSFLNIGDERLNFRSAKAIAAKGNNVQFNPYFEGERHADLIVNGELAELKGAGTNNPNRINSAIKDAKGQARTIFLELNSETTYTSQAIKRGLRQAQHNGYDFDTLGFIYKDRMITTSRDDLFSEGFTKQLETLVKR